MFELPRSGDDPAASLGHDARLHVANHWNGLGIPMSGTFQQVSKSQHNRADSSLRIR
jgi:hypothetical protein